MPNHIATGVVVPVLGLSNSGIGALSSAADCVVVVTYFGGLCMNETRNGVPSLGLTFQA